MKKKVVIIQRALKSYRVKFFELLREKCSQNNIELILIYGNDDVITFNDANIDEGIKVKNHKIYFGGKNLYYQNVWKYIKDADLIIVEQANKHITNYILWVLNILKIKKLAFWGHGLNFQNDNTILSNISEFLKKQLTKRIHWFFAYTNLSKEIVVKMGLSPNRITIINNTISVEDLKEEITKYDDIKLQKIKDELGIKSNNVCIYIGGMYKEKRLDFLIEALKLIKKEIIDFEMIFIGDGPDKEKIVKFEKENKWVHYLGVCTEKEKVPYLLISKLILMPGLVGLIIVDSFVFGVPLITTDCKLHSPEISYLENDVNGIITENDVKEYASKVIELLADENKRQKIVKGSRISAEKYTMSNMVNNFMDGIKKNIG